MIGRRSFRTVAILIGVILLAGCWWYAGLALAAPDLTTTDIPDVVLLDTLSKTEGLYELVPFNHKAHASMSGMKNGCVTCHHRQPEARTQPANTMPANHGGLKNQAEAAIHPACRTCHEPHRVDLRQPGLKGAYHRQCLNCHREWAQANSCNVCHKPKVAGAASGKQPTRDDILGRMHPPIPEPQEHLFKARFTPADGPNVLFRHKEHIDRYGVKCTVCHQAEDSCSRCHGGGAPMTQPEPRHAVAIDRTWEQAHAQCSSCHVRQENQCTTCHYKEDQKPPVAFEHAMTGQVLDASHVNLKCGDCHTGWAPKAAMSCGTADCHKSGAVTYPAKRPGPLVPRNIGPQTPPVKPMTVPSKSNTLEASARAHGLVEDPHFSGPRYSGGGLGRGPSEEDCKLQIVNCKMQIEGALVSANLQFAICNSQFAIKRKGTLVDAPFTPEQWAAARSS